MKSDIVIILIISFVLLFILIFFITKKMREMTVEERQREIDKSLDRASWLTIVKNILKLFTH